MNKIEEILQKHTACEGTCECGCGLVEAMSEFGEICFNAGIQEGTEKTELQLWSCYTVYMKTYEDFLKEIENEH
jgi:hypothetical protein